MGLGWLWITLWFLKSGHRINPELTVKLQATETGGLCQGLNLNGTHRLTTIKSEPLRWRNHRALSAADLKKAKNASASLSSKCQRHFNLQVAVLAGLDVSRWLGISTAFLPCCSVVLCAGWTLCRREGFDSSYKPHTTPAPWLGRSVFDNRGNCSQIKSYSWRTNFERKESREGLAAGAIGRSLLGFGH